MRQEKPTRICKFYGKILAGVDLGNILKENTVYQVTECMGIIQLVEIGETALNSKGMHKYSSIMKSGVHLVTKKEMELIKEKEIRNELRDNGIFYTFDKPTDYYDWKDKHNL